MRWISPRLIALFLTLLSAVNASDSNLHPLAVALPEAEVQFVLRELACPDEAVAIECTYRPYRERDVLKERSFQLIGSLFRAGSHSFIHVTRDEQHSEHRSVTATAEPLRFSVALRDPDPAHHNYGLASVRVGRLTFARWSEAAPTLDRGFGLECAADTLRGSIRLGGLGASPLAGSLPLWPGLRTVDLTITPVTQPGIELWDPMTKHHWDGWRQATPQEWPGGRSIVARHLAGPTVWRAHEYFAFPPSGAPAIERPAPPSDTLSGTALEIFWPTGDRLEFPDVKFDEPVDVLALPVARLTPRIRELLTRASTLRPGVELHSLTTAEWNEIETLADTVTDKPAELALEKTTDDKDLLTLKRRTLAEPWLYVFGAGYDTDRLRSVSTLLLSPTAWTGALPE